jgi:uncharacterized protein (TIGR02246 family)
MPGPLTVEDRAAIDDVLGRYVWTLDTGDADGVAACFTPDGSALDTQGNRYSDIKSFALEFIERPDFRGRQHVVTHLFYEGDSERCVVTSYWTVVKWRFAQNTKEVASVGYSHDTMEKRDGRWLIHERALGWLTDQHGPWFGPGSEAAE